MLRGALLAFVGGWIVWFWIDKNPATLGPLAYPVDGDFVYNFQVTIDLIKQARFKAAFVFAWKAHYLVLSLAVGAASGMVLAALSRRLSRNRLLQLYLPRKQTRSNHARAQQESRD
jgi:hypothetical protein